MGNAIMISGRMTKLLRMCVEYYPDAFGAPNHMLLVLAGRLFFALPKIIIPLDPCPSCGKTHTIEAINITTEDGSVYFGFCENSQRIVEIEKGV